MKDSEVRKITRKSRTEQGEKANEVYKRIAHNIWIFRTIYLKESQEKLAEKAQLSTGYISKIENGCANGCSCESIIKIAEDGFGLPPCIMLSDVKCPIYIKLIQEIARDNHTNIRNRIFE